MKLHLRKRGDISMNQKHSQLEKKEEEKDRMKIIHGNFFYYLEDRGITQKKICL